MAENYDLQSEASRLVPAPELPYGPPSPKHLRPRIGLIGCGGITAHHLKAYVAAGWEVVAFYDARAEAAEARRAEFYPDARVCESVSGLLAMDEINVVDIATHPGVRGPLIEQAILAGKHVLSQKPFVQDLAEGARLAALAKASGVKLAVNQNGRWAPYFSYLRHAIRAGLIGEVSSVNIAIDWDHTWTAGTAFEEIHHLVLYDFAIHWFDATHSFFGGAPAQSVYATVRHAPGQVLKPPLIASVVIAYESGLATLTFDGSNRSSGQESCTIIGTQGSLRGLGKVCGIPAIDVVTPAGQARAELTGSWFPDGFRGAMGELLCAIEEDREPETNAFDNLKSLALCFAAMKSADEQSIVNLT